MRNNYLLCLILSSCILLLSSCGSDPEPISDCSDQAINTTLSGTWNVLNSTVTFNTDGFYIDDDRILNDPIVPESEISARFYSLSTDDEVTVRIATTSGTSVSVSYKIIVTNCDEIQLEWVAGTTNFVLTR